MRQALVMAVAALVVASCSAAPQPAPSDPARDLADKVNAGAIFAHLEALDAIATDHQGNRAVGTPGYEATVDYVAGVLRDGGFAVTTPEFEWLKMGDPGRPTLGIAGRSYPVTQASPLAGTPRGGVSGLSLRPRKPAGCAAADYGEVRGALAIVDDTGCSVVAKQDAAVAKGAVGLLVVSAGGTEGLFEPGYYQKLTLPVAVIDRATDAALRRTSAPVRLTLDAQASVAKSRNVIAQTTTGDTTDVVLAGANLDSAPRSPGINDNGTGVAALLSIAAALGSAPAGGNAVRFAFWGSESLGAASKYIAGLDDDQLDDIAAYLDADMLGSPNAGYFTLDGDQSAAPSEAPEGSAGIERTLAGYLNLAGKRPADMPLNTRTDYHPFLVAGIPVGGMNTGASQTKTTVQARLWGGQAGAAFDPNYHSARDTVDAINRDALAVMGAGVAFAVGTYADSVAGVNGVPAHDKRHRTRVS